MKGRRPEFLARRETVWEFMRSGGILDDSAISELASRFSCTAQSIILDSRLMPASGNLVRDGCQIRALHATVRERDGEVCQYCGAMAQTRFYEWGEAYRERRCLDHVVPVVLGGVTEAFNLVVCCVSCNNVKSNRTWIPLNLDMLTSEHPEWKERILETACLKSQATRETVKYPNVKKKARNTKLALPFNS